MPQELNSRVVSLDAAPQADVVRQFQALLDAGDAAALADWIADNRYRLKMGPIGEYMQAGHNTDSTEAAMILQRLFEAGSRPRVEGFTVIGDATSPCLSIVTSGWRGEVTIAVPTADGEMGPGPSEIKIPGGEQRWDLCVNQAGERIWKTWRWGGYGDLVSDMAVTFGNTEERPYLVVRPVGSTSPVTSPNLGITLDVPAGWVVDEDGTLMLKSFHATIDHGGIPEEWTKIDVRRSGSNPGAGDNEEPQVATPIPTQHLSLGPNRYPADRIDAVGELGRSSTLRVTVADEVYEFNCFGDCTALERIAASIRPAEAAP
jgi:hypothetical protein